MDLYSIGDEEETPGSTSPSPVSVAPQKRQMHPAFLPSSLPVQHVAKGTKSAYLGSPIYYCMQLKRKPLLRKLLSKVEKEWVSRVLKMKEGFLYAYERAGDVWVLRGVWDLTRLISIELSSSSSDEVTLVFPHPSLEPCEPLRKKSFRVSDLPALLDSLRTRLRDSNIDLDFTPVTM